jgi:transcriptional regulator with XRE-family HTH domain
MTPLKAARVARGWSQEKLAKLAGLPQPTISRAERNGSATTDIALRIAAAMGSTVEDLFDTKADDTVELVHDAAAAEPGAAA